MAKRKRPAGSKKTARTRKTSKGASRGRIVLFKGAKTTGKSGKKSPPQPPPSPPSSPPPPPPPEEPPAVTAVATTAAPSLAMSQAYARAWDHLEHPQQRAFLAAYAVNGGFVTQAAATADVDRRTHPRWMQQPDYAAAFVEAQAVACDLTEEAAHRRAVEGLVSYQYTKDGSPLRHPVTGEPYYELKFSDALLIKRLEALQPERYKRKQIELTGKDGGPIVNAELRLQDLPDAELDAMHALATKPQEQRTPMERLLLRVVGQLGS